VHDEATTDAPPPTTAATGTPTAEQRFR